MPSDNQDDNDDVEGQRDRQLQIYLAHYQVIRAEIVQHLAAQVQFINYLVVVLGASGAGAGILLEAERSHLIAPLTILLPIVVTPLAYHYYYSDFIVLGLSNRASGTIQDKIAYVASDPDLNLKNQASEQLSRVGRGSTYVISGSRWLVWIFPTVGPTVYGWMHRYDQWGNTFVFLLLVDTVLTMLLIFMVFVVIQETRLRN